MISPTPSLTRLLKVTTLGLIGSSLIACASSESTSSDTAAIKNATGSSANYVAPRNEYGQPDLRGVWNFSSNTPLVRPKQFGDREFLTKEEVAQIHAATEARSQATDEGNAELAGDSVGGYNQFWVESAAQFDNYRTSLIIDPKDGQMPARVAGAVIQRGGLGPDIPSTHPVRFRVGGIAKDGPEDRGLSERCLMGFNSGPPFMPSMYNNNVQIFQNKNHVVIMTEMIHDARIVPIDGRPHLTDELKQWSGDSRGYWDGDTLVVETRNFTDKTQTFRSTGIASNMKLTERFTRVDDNHVNYQFTIDDAQSFERPFTVLVPMVKVDGEIFEYACHEGNYGMFNILAGQRKAEADAKK